MNIQDMQAILEQMIDLTGRADEIDWMRVFSELNAELNVDPNAASAKIRQLFGGAGSLNDLVLHANGRPMRVENDLLDASRVRLFALVRE